MKTNGTAALEGKDRKREPAKGSSKKKDSGLTVSEIRARRVHDGTYHIEHHYQDAKGLPHHQVHEYSAASRQDVADHMLEHLPEDEGQDAAAGDEAGASQPAAQPVASQAQAGAPGEE